MVLLRDLKGATQPGRSKDMSVHVSTWIIYDFRVLTPIVMEIVALIRCFSSRCMISDRFLSNDLILNFSLNYERMQITFVHYSPNLMGEKL
jgi:hypothetical protein